MKKLFLALAGLLSGLLAGIFGAGGGIAAVPLLGKAGLDEKQKHASSVFLILGVSVAGAAVAVSGDPSVLKLCLPFVAGTVGGGILSALLLKKLNNKLIKILFGLLLIAGSLRLAVAK